MQMTAEELSRIAGEALEFRDGLRSLHLATAAAGADPVASYAPFSLSPEGGFYIYVSELAAHTASLLAGNPVGVLLIEAEQDAADVFARRRLTMTCDVAHHARGTARFDAIMDAMCERFGETMVLLRTLTDFHAFELAPRQASYVRGFAQAYEFPHADFSGMRHVDDRGRGDSS